MPGLIIVAVVGFVAQLIDGGMGMGYGVISSSLLLAAGIAPAAAAASVQLSAIGTSLASGAAHWRFGNVDWHVVPRIALPGAAGAFIGATVLSALPAHGATAWTSAILFGLGGYLLLRFARSAPAERSGRSAIATAFLAPLGFVAGGVTAMGGGGWGPIATSTLLASGRLDPKKTVGSVSAAEFAVAVAASLGFLIGLSGGVVWPVVLPLLAGGVAAAPLAAWLIRRLPTRILGVSVGAVILGTNANTLFTVLAAPAAVRIAGFAALAAAFGVALTVVLRARRSAAKPEPVRIPA